MRPPYSSFHCQTRRSNSSRPESHARQFFFRELPLHHHLRGNAGVIRARQPQRRSRPSCDASGRRHPSRCGRACGRCAASPLRSAGGMTSENTGRLELSFSRDKERCRSTTAPNAAQTAGAHRLFRVPSGNFRVSFAGPYSWGFEQRSIRPEVWPWSCPGKASFPSDVSGKYRSDLLRPSPRWNRRRTL